MKFNHAFVQTQAKVFLFFCFFYSHAILVAVTSECNIDLRGLSVKPGLGHWQTVQTQIRCRRKRRLMRARTVCLNYRKLSVK